MARADADAMVKTKMASLKATPPMGPASFKLIGPSTTRLLVQGPHMDPDGRLWAECTTDQSTYNRPEGGRRSAKVKRSRKGKGGDDDSDRHEGGSGSDLDMDKEANEIQGGKVGATRVLRGPRIFW